MTIYSYPVVRDFGFAPNPFYGCCTLATCKPIIRKNAKVNDWIIGTGSYEKGLGGKLIYVMQVDRILTFKEYWEAEEFKCKKPIMNGSLKQKYGDNIYRYDEKKHELVQVNSHHSRAHGVKNEDNYQRDTSGKKVLIGNKFWYFGEEAPEIPKDILNHVEWKKQGHRKLKEDIGKIFLEWLFSTYEQGYYGDPCEFKYGFKRYDGKS